MADLTVAIELIGKNMASGPIGDVVTSLTSLEGKGLSSAQAMAGVGAAMTVVGVAGVAAIGSAVSAAAEFEKTMSAVKAVMTPDEVDAFGSSLEALALKLGKDTAFSAGEAAAGIEQLVKGGVSATDILDGAAAATLNLAAAGGVSLPDAAEIASNALNMFSLSGKDMAHVADLIAGAANASSMEVGDFKFALSQVGAVARTVGLSFDDTATAISVLAAQGLKGSDAGTSLKTMLINLVPQTDKASEAFQKYGFETLNAAKLSEALVDRGIDPVGMSLMDQSFALEKAVTGWDGMGTMTKKQAGLWEDATKSLGLYQNEFFDANGSVRSFADISGLLADKLGDLSSEEQIVALKTLFGTDAMRAAAIMMRTGAEGANAMAESMSKVTAEAVGAARMDNLTGSIEQLKGSFETLQITIGQRLLPVVRGFVDAGTGMLNWFLELPEPVANTALAVAAVVTAVGLIGGPLLMLVAVLPAVATGFTLLAAPIAAVALPVILITGLIAVLAAAWINDWGDIREHTADAIQFIQDGLSSWGFIFDQVGRAVNQFAADVGDYFDRLGTQVNDSLTAIHDALVFVFITGPQALSDALATWLNSVADAFGAAFDALGTLIHDAWQGYVDFISGVLDAIESKVSEIWESIPVDIRESLAAIAANIEARWEGFLSFIGDTLDHIGTAINDAWQAYVTFIDDRLTDIDRIVREVWTGVMTWLGDRFDALGTVLNLAWQGYVDFIDGALNAISGFVHEKWDALLVYAGTLWEAIKNAIAEKLSGASGALAVVTTWMGSVLATMTQFAIDGAAKAAEIGIGIVTGIGAGIGAAWGVVTAAFADLIRGLLNGVKALLGISSPSTTWASQVGEPIAEGIIVGASAKLAEEAHVVLDQVNALMAGARQAITGGGNAYIGGGLEQLGAVSGTGLTGTNAAGRPPTSTGSTGGGGSRTGGSAGGGSFGSGLEAWRISIPGLTPEQIYGNSVPGFGPIVTQPTTTSMFQRPVGPQTPGPTGISGPSYGPDANLLAQFGGLLNATIGLGIETPEQHIARVRAEELAAQAAAGNVSDARPVTINQTNNVYGTDPASFAQAADMWIDRAQWQAGMA
jgi:hypothetical protein